MSSDENNDSDYQSELKQKKTSANGRSNVERTSSRTVRGGIVGSSRKSGKQSGKPSGGPRKGNTSKRRGQRSSKTNNEENSETDVSFHDLEQVDRDRLMIHLRTIRQPSIAPAPAPIEKIWCSRPDCNRAEGDMEPGLCNTCWRQKMQKKEAVQRVRIHIYF